MSLIFPLLSLLIGSFIGLLIISDPILANAISHGIDFTIVGRNVFKLFPFEILILTFLSVLSVSFFRIFINLFMWILAQYEKVLVLLILVASQTIAIHKFGPLDGADVMVGIAFMVLIIKGLVRNEGITITFLDVLNLFLLIFILLSIMNGGIASFVRTSLAFKLFLLSFLMTNFVYKIGLPGFVIKWLIIVTLASAVFAIFQDILYLSKGIAFVGIVDKSDMKYMFEDTSYGRMLRVPALLVSYKNFAFLLMTNLLIILNRFLYSPPEGMKSKVCLSLAFAVMLVALLLTFSKDSLLAFSIGVMLSLFVRWPHYAIHGLAGILLLFLFIYLGGFFDDIYNSITTEFSFGEYRIRLQLAREGISGFLHRHPWIGNGFFRESRYTSHYIGWATHNNLILAGDGIGLLGLLSYILPIGYSLLMLLSLNFKALGNKDRAIVRGLLFSMVSLLIVLQTHMGYLDATLWMYMGITQGVFLLYFKKDRLHNVSA